MAAQETQASVSLQRPTIRYLATKAALGELRSFFKRLQRHSGIKDLKTTAQEKKEDSFIVPASSCLPNWHCSSPRGNSPDGENSPHQERKSGVSDELPSPSAAPHGSHASTSPYPRSAARRRTEMARTMTKSRGH